MTLETTFETDRPTHTTAQEFFGNWEGAGGGLGLNAGGSIYCNIYINGAWQNVNGGAIEANKIYHAACTFDGEELIIYLNGKEKARKSLSGTIAISPAKFFLGCNPSSSNVCGGGYFKGKIYNVAVWDYALTPNQIAADAGVWVRNGGTYGTLPTPVRRGYTFEGWYTGKPTGGSGYYANASGTKVTSSSTFSGTADSSLYANWTENTAPTITLNKTSASISATGSTTFTAKPSVAGTWEIHSCTYATVTGSTTATANTATTFTVRGTGTAGNCKVYVRLIPTSLTYPIVKSSNITITTTGGSTNPIAVSGRSLTYNTAAQNLVTVSGSTSTYGTLYYSTTTQLTASNYSSSGSTTIPTATNAGSYTIYYYTPGKGSYNPKSGAVSTTIAKYNLGNATIGSVATQLYTGSAIKPTPTVKMGSITLTNGTHYSLSYSDNIDQGYATITVSPKNTTNFTGSKNKSFMIVYAWLVSTTNLTFDEIDLSSTPNLAEYSLDNQTYSGSGVDTQFQAKVGA